MTKAQRWRRLDELGLTAKDVADELGMHKASVARVLNGDSFSVDIATCLAKHFGCSIREAFPKAPARVLRKAAA